MLCDVKINGLSIACFSQCFQMRHEVVAALRSNASPEGLPPMDSHIVVLRSEGTSALALVRSLNIHVYKLHNST